MTSTLDSHAAATEILKRHPEKALNINELLLLQTVPYQYFKDEPIFLDLLLKYCQDCKIILIIINKIINIHVLKNELLIIF